MATWNLIGSQIVEGDLAAQGDNTVVAQPLLNLEVCDTVAEVLDEVNMQDKQGN